MERDIDKSPSEIEAGNDKFFSTTQEKNTEIDKDKIKKKEFNSWDCSTPSTHEENPKKKKNDWDSSSECQEETLVEPFDSNAKDCDNWNSSESEDKSVPRFSFGKNKELGEHSRSSSLSSGLFIADSSEIDKNSSIDMFKIIGSDDEKSRNSSRKNYVKNEDDLLLVEDIEEFLRDDDLPKTQQSKEISPATAENSNSGTGSEKVRSNHSEGTTDDTTIWMIPKSERTLSADSITKPMTCSDRIETVNNFKISLKKAKSLSDTQKCKSQRKSTRSSRSDRLGLVHSNKNNLDNFLVKCEGSSLQKNLDAKSKTKKEGISHNKCFDRTAVFFTEYECRAMTMDKDVPEKSTETSVNVFGSNENIQPQVAEESSDDDPNRPNRETRNSEAAISEMALAGPPASTSLDVVSLPDMRGRNALKTPAKEKFTRRVTNPEKGKIESQKPQSEQSATTNQLNESWFLLDETGQYQAVTKNEVTILLNGRSADAVLQGKKEHVIPNANLGDLTSPHSSISGMITKESLQYFLREEDIGGEDNGKKLDLERKVENTLLYIQPGMNLTASIRIIPVDTEMIHIWRRTRDSGSMLSSEVDLRFHSSQESFENTGQKNFNRQPSFIPRMAMNNSHQTLDELDETLLAETPREENISSNQMENSDYSSLLLETRMIVDSLTNNFKTLQNRLDGESSKSSALQTEVSKLRNLLKNIGGKSFFDKSFRETISDHHFLQSDVSSSISLLTVKGADKTDIKSESVLEEASEVDPVFQSSVDIPQDDAGSRCQSQSRESRGFIRNGVQSECLPRDTTESACSLKNVSKSRCLLDDVAECRSLLQDIESRTLIQNVVDHKSVSRDMSESKSLTRDNSKPKTSSKNVIESALQDEVETESLRRILKESGSLSKSKENSSSFLEEAKETESLSKNMAESGRLPRETSELRSLSKDKMESKSSAEEVKTKLQQREMSESRSLSRDLRDELDTKSLQRDRVESRSLSQNQSNYKSASKDEMEKDMAQNKPQLKDEMESKSKTDSRSSSKDEMETKSLPKNASEIKSLSKGLEESRSSLKSEKEIKSLLKGTTQFRDEVETRSLLKDSAQLISQSRSEMEDKLSSKDLPESRSQIREEVEIRSLSKNLAEATSFLNDKAESKSISVKEGETKSISNGIKETRSQSRDEIETNSLTKNSVESKSISNSSRNMVDMKSSPKDMMESRSLLKHQTETKSLSRSISGSRSSSKSTVESKALVEDELESKLLIKGMEESRSSSKGMAESKSLLEEEVEMKLLSRDMEDYRSISSGSERSRSSSKYKITPKNKVDHSEVEEIPEMLDEPECSYGNSAGSKVPLGKLQQSEHSPEDILELECHPEETIRPRWIPQEMPSQEKLGNSCNADNGYITVNIYTMEVSPSRDCLEKGQENNSMLQTNLGMIEGKMKRLQEENDIIAKQNYELKKKLKEISFELEKYLASTSEVESNFEEELESEALRDQVCNLKLELDNLKKSACNTENQIQSEKFLIHEEYQKTFFCLEEWLTAVSVIFQEIQIEKNRLFETGVVLDINFDPGMTNDPKIFLTTLSSYLRQITDCLITIRDQTTTHEKLTKESTDSLEMKTLDRVISGYGELIEQCRRGAGEPGNKVMEDYFTVIMEKASLMEEIKILKTENEMLLEGQLEHYEKLKQTMIALKDRKSEITALESSQEFLEEEKNKMVDVIKSYEDKSKKMEDEILKKSKMVEDLEMEKKSRELDLNDAWEKLKAAAGEIKNFEKSCRLKDELINEFKKENDELLITVGMKDNEIELLENEMKNLETRKNELECHLSSTELLLNESQKEMTEYITHLETLVNNSQDSLEKTKQKLKESNQIVSRLKNEIDVSEKQHQCDLKLYNKTKDELETLKENHQSLSKIFREVEEEKGKIQKNLEIVSVSEKQKTEALEAASKECKRLLNENTSLKEKLEAFSKDKDESLKEQKDLINKYAMLSKEVQKLQEKYKNVKAECNERTDLIKYLEMMLKENLIEYNARIACLEKNISHIIEKIAACKNCMKEKHLGVDVEVKELRHQLDVTYQERKELEHVISNYYSLMKHLESEIQEREKKMDELHVKLSKEQQKAADYDTTKKPSQVAPVEVRSLDSLKIEKLENQIATAEKELLECRNQLHNCQNNYENEKKKLELTIADLKSEINRYQIRIEVMMRNLSNYNKNTNVLPPDKRTLEDANIQSMKKMLEEKEKKIIELNEMLNKCKTEVQMKNSELENSKRKNCSLNEDIKKMQNQFLKLNDALSATNQNNEVQQREKDEMAEKLLQSIKLIMEEKATRQTVEALAMEKEKHYREELEKMKSDLNIKEKELEKISAAFQDKKKLANKLQEDIKKMKLEMSSLKSQVGIYKKRDGENHLDFNDPSNHVSLDRLESCMKELKEVRDANLQLRKSEGFYQGKIVRLEDEIRDARLSIKELQGDIKTEKKARKALKKMIMSAKAEVEKCLLAKQIILPVADKIKRHLNVSEVPSRELLSGFRLRDSDSSP